MELGDNPLEEETVAKYEDVFNDFFTQISNKIIDAAREKVAGYPYNTAFFIKLGYPYEEIVDLAKEVKADSIVMGSRGISGITELLLGSVSTKVSQHAEIPVLIVK